VHHHGRSRHPNPVAPMTGTLSETLQLRSNGLMATLLTVG
jgi:hypothetical protein